MIKVTFVYPDFSNLGVQYLMATCLANGYDAELVHYRAEDIFLNMKSDAVRYSEIAKKIALTKPDIVGFSCVTDNFSYQLNCAKAVKELLPDVLTVFGGIHVTAVPGEVLKNDVVDCIAIGEAESSFLSFLKAGDRNGKFSLPEQAVRGIVFKKGGSYIGDFVEGPLPDLNLLPFPHAGPFYSNLKWMRGFYTIMSSRGCPGICAYCFNSFFLELRGNGKIRRREVGNVIDELVAAKKKFRLKFVSFSDDCFVSDRKWLLEFCNRYKQEVGLRFQCNVIPRLVDDDTARMLAESGCVYVTVGVQSTSESLCRDVLHRRSDNGAVSNAIKSLRKYGIFVQVDHMLGFPGDTIEAEEDAIRFYNDNRPNLVSVYWLCYYPKTPIVETAIKMGYLTESDKALLEKGIRLSSYNYHTGGSMKNPAPYYPVAFMLHYLPILPKSLVAFLLRKNRYRFFKSGNFHLSVALPHVLQCIFDKRDVQNRMIFKRFFMTIFNR